MISVRKGTKTLSAFLRCYEATHLSELVFDHSDPFAVMLRENAVQQSRFLLTKKRQCIAVKCSKALKCSLYPKS